MPEYPDITIYIEHLDRRLKNQIFEKLRIASPFVLRTAQPAVSEFEGSKILGFERLGKRIVFQFPHDHFLVLHLMVSGRLRWKEKNTKVPRKTGLAAFEFPNGNLLLTEASPQKRASIHLIKGRGDLDRLNPGGVEPLSVSPERFRQVLNAENHTLKRALTDPKILSGIGNAYSDEILHRARLSPIKLTEKLLESEHERLYNATRETLAEWTDRLRDKTGERFPEKVTAFHEEMAVHGKFGQPCPECSTRIQRIRYAKNETNYCPQCQTEGKLLADRALSRLLKKDWPRSLDEFDNLIAGHRDR